MEINEKVFKLISGLLIITDNAIATVKFHVIACKTSMWYRLASLNKTETITLQKILKKTYSISYYIKFSIHPSPTNIPWL